ncbi:MAG: hypothetical protein ACOYXU_14320 [Nitrospirota bacterium]
MAVITLLFSGSVGAQPEEFAPDLDTEFRAVLPLAKAVAGDKARFLELVKPMAPLDLSTFRSVSATQASDDKNFFFGVMGTAAGLDEPTIKEIPNEFFKRYRVPGALVSVKNKATDVVSLLREFDMMRDLTVVAVWSDGEFRLDDLIRVEGRYSLRREVIQHSSGFSLPVELKERVDHSTALRQRMATLGVVALVREPFGTRVIFDGCADDEIGLLFWTTSVDPKASFSDGKSMVFGEPVSRRVTLYMTN